MANDKLGLYMTKEAAGQIGRSKATLLRWIADGEEADVANRDDNNARLWTAMDIKRFIACKNRIDNRKKLTRIRKKGSDT